ncbi:uncharacterized protein LOC125889260 isoform X4 [Epinephelus fuscoguttatus]|uniref:uncharacterized protein LOC125889260 isoform X4 n=1 Tax=Epinephelus fuscoguttatus TaxID=293821 RepID=UPI0020D1F0C0|nr:uncharacterized protein LOC125889260 isoform X4 [Epinephelus fuscoguttatus]
MICWALALVWLICGFPTGCEGAPAALKSNSNEETCKNQLHPGAGLSCCGGNAFNPEKATCCKAEDGYNQTDGLSQKVSVCCGLKAYDRFNEICCQLTVIAKPVPKARCCGKEAYDEDTQLCCSESRIILKRNSTDHECCGKKQYNKKTECCCPDNLEIRPKHPNCCMKQSGLHGTNPNNTPSKQIDCSQSTALAFPAPNAVCCGNKAFNSTTQLCCSERRIILERNSIDHECCGKKQYNKKTECCCPDNLEIRPKHPNCCMKQSGLHGTNPNNTPSKQIDCSQSTALAFPAPNAVCCGNKAFNSTTQLCCSKRRIILERNSIDHECCGKKQYNKKTECCCPDNLEIQSKHSNCCMKQSGAPQQSPASQPICTEPNSIPCGSSCYNPNHFRCCEKSQENSLWCCAPGRCEDTPSVYNPHTQICCDGCVSEWKPWLDQCCGETAYGFAQRGVLCCNNTLFTGREDGEECSALGVPFNPAKETMCSFKFHDSPGRHCCGTEKYHPKTEICCDGHRHQNRTENTRCCGRKVYDIQDPLVKCCGGILHNLNAGHKEQCCGSVLQTSQHVCCSSEDKEVLYMAKTAFRCCGHRYYNLSLWSCCAGKLSPVRPPGTMSKESRLLSVDNVKDADLCNKMHIGIVESVSSHSVVFSSVLMIHGRNATVTSLASPYILKKHDHCTFPKLTAWRSYFFDGVNVFADFNHYSTLQSLHFILSRCYRP